MFVAYLSDARPIVIGGDNDTVRARHAFHDDGSDLVRPFVADNFLEMLDALPFAGFQLLPERTAIAERIQEVDRAGHGRLDRIAAVVARQSH